MSEERETQEQDIEASRETEPASAEALSLEEQQTLREENKRLEDENRNLHDQLLRRQAEFQNFRKRMDRNQQEFRQSAQAGLVAELLPVLDAFELALSHAPAGASDEYHKGIELIYKRLVDTLAAAGLEPVQAVGQHFDPLYHHAVERVESAEHPDQQVIAEMQRGYSFQQRLLRPALVKVAVHPAPAREETEFED
jgi:molecular chaperone GrpE